MHNRRKTMQFKGKILSIIAVLSLMTFCVSANINASSTEETKEPKNVRIPLELEVSHAIAGADFVIEYTSGLKFLSFEKSDTISTAYTTPVVEKKGKTYFGFYYGSNDFEPIDGLLDVGYLVFEHNGDPDQYMLLTEAKYVEVIDKDNTNSRILILNEKTDVPYPIDPTPEPSPTPTADPGTEPSPSPTTDPGTEPSPTPSTEPGTSPTPAPTPGTDAGSEPGPKLGEESIAPWIAMWLASAAAAIGCIFFGKKKKAGRA